MADISEVLDAVRDAAAKVLYPNGAPSGPMPKSVIGAPVRLYVGWPDASLDEDLRKGICHITIWPSGVSREVNGGTAAWKSGPPPSPPSMTATTGDQTVTFAGDTTVPYQIAAILVGRDTAYTYVLPPEATPQTVAAAMATAIGQDREALAEGPTVRVPGATRIIGRVVAGGMEQRELRRRQEGFQIAAWCPTPKLRDDIIRQLDEAFADDFRSLTMPDGTIASLTYGGSPFDEEARTQPLHRRDLLMSAEFPTIQRRMVPGIAVATLNITHDPSLITRIVIV